MERECIRFVNLAAPFDPADPVSTPVNGRKQFRSINLLSGPGVNQAGDGASIRKRAVCPLTRVQGPVTEGGGAGNNLTVYSFGPEADLNPLGLTPAPDGDMRAERDAALPSGLSVRFTSECAIFNSAIGTPGNPWKWLTQAGDSSYVGLAGAPATIAGFPVVPNEADHICYIAGFSKPTGAILDVELFPNSTTGNYQVRSGSDPALGTSTETYVECIERDQS